ncbi:hypothetical protein PY32053_01625 [Paracoccus yeei]|uniref:Uncharacterized protein n=1 Tax=Paracoccus yeei TaxID=147645 RepID=A0A386UN61_9RHOB|nr:hypothetical protein [Paracoccus yeei]AYF01252.1 hypothetical protein PY32053_01625 [Paracoccus yeei]
MDSIKTIVPIFILKTRSFWLGIFPILLTLGDMLFSGLSDADGGPLVGLIAMLTGYAVPEVQAFLLKLTPIWGLIIAQQRGGFGGGIPRPYTLDPAKEKQILEVVEDGKSAFEAGKAFGAAIKQRPGLIQAGKSPDLIKAKSPAPREE